VAQGRVKLICVMWLPSGVRLTVVGRLARVVWLARMPAGRATQMSNTNRSVSECLLNVRAAEYALTLTEYGSPEHRSAVRLLGQAIAEVQIAAVRDGVILS
jgi:hypothetical protein